MNGTTRGATITADQAHELIGKENISRGSFYKALRRNEIPNLRLGKRVLIPRHAFMQWLEGAGVTARTPAA